MAFDNHFGFDHGRDLGYSKTVEKKQKQPKKWKPEMRRNRQERWVLRPKNMVNAGEKFYLDTIRKNDRKGITFFLLFQ